MRKIIGFIFILFLTLPLFSQTDKADYIEKYKSIAIKKMKQFGIPASITLAQGIIESRSGKSDLAIKANNHFGIKCHNEWDGKTFIMDDDTRNECFRQYKNAEQSFDDHSLFLTSRNRYAFLFEYNATDYKRWAKGLQKAGYATNPKYAEMLIKVIEDNNLHRFDKGRKGKDLENEEPVIAQNKISSKYPEYIEKDQDFKPVSVSATNRVIYEMDGVQYILALQNDSWKIIADEFDIYTKQILDFNSAKRKTVLNAGDRVYIENKNRRAKVLFHIVQQGETLRSISQKYAIRTSWVKRVNKIRKKDNVIPGQRLRLR